MRTGEQATTRLLFQGGSQTVATHTARAGRKRSGPASVGAVAARLKFAVEPFLLSLGAMAHFLQY